MGWTAFLGPALLLLLTRAYLASQISGAAEDAYITFRYASNWARGLGPVFNPGERVWGFSSPLWTGLLALLALLRVDLTLASRALAIGLDLVSLVLGMRLLAGHLRVAAWAYGIFWALHSLPASLASSGMESNLFWCLMLVTASLMQARRTWLMGLSLAALALVRPEGLFAAAVMAVWAPNRARLLALVLVAATWGALRAYFGQWIPQSVIAKALTYGAPGLWYGRQWYNWILPFQFGKWPETAEGDNLLPLALLSFPGMIAGCAWLWKERRSAVAALVAGGLTVLAGYAAVGVTFFYWYLLIPLMAVVVCAAVGLASIHLPRLVWLSALVYMVGNWTVMGRLYSGRAKIERMMMGGAGDALKQDAESRGAGGGGRAPLVFLEPIGWVGWRSGLRVADEVGLVTPWVARRRLQGAGWYTDFVQRENPDYLVVRASMLATGQAFTGQGAPFRSPQEMQRVFSQYQRFHPPPEVQVGANELVALRRLAASPP